MFALSQHMLITAGRSFMCPLKHPSVTVTNFGGKARGYIDGVQTPSSPLTVSNNFSKSYCVSTP